MVDVVKTDGQGGMPKASSEGAPVGVTSDENGTKEVDLNHKASVTAEEAQEALALANKESEGEGPKSEGDSDEDKAKSLETEEATADSDSKQEDGTPSPVELTDTRLQDLQKEYDETGEVSPETLAAKAKELGISEEVMKYTIQGLQANQQAAQAIVDKQVSDIKAKFGGEEGFNEFSEWARDNLDPNQLEAYEELNEAQNFKALSVMVDGFKSQYESAGNTTRRDITESGGTKQSSPTERFESQAEMTKAISNPDFDRDPAYRRRVEQKIVNSNFDGS